MSGFVSVKNAAVAKRLVIDSLVFEYRIPESKIEVIEPITYVQDTRLSKASYSVKVKVTLPTNVVKEHQFAVHAYTGEVSTIY